MKTFILLISMSIPFSMKIKDRVHLQEYIQGKFVYELNGDSCLINFWGQNYNEFPKSGLWSWSDKKGIDFERGFFCFGQADFEDSILYQGFYRSSTDYHLNDQISLMALNNDTVINYKGSKKSGKILEKLNSIEVRKKKYSMYSIFHPIDSSNLKHRFGFVNIRMKVERYEKMDLERCVFKMRGKKNFTMISIPYYRVLEIDSIW